MPTENLSLTSIIVQDPGNNSCFSMGENLWWTALLSPTVPHFACIHTLCQDLAAPPTIPTPWLWTLFMMCFSQWDVSKHAIAIWNVLICFASLLEFYHHHEKCLPAFWSEKDEIHGANVDPNCRTELSPAEPSHGKPGLADLQTHEQE